MHADATGYRLHPDPAAASGWRVSGDGADLDDWLRDREAVPLAKRVPVLVYGSNACPAKVTWLRTELGLAAPAVVLLAECDGLAAVWAVGLRSRDGQRPATLAAAPGVRERHAVWLADQHQLRVLDRCETRGTLYRLARVRSGRVTLADGSSVADVFSYVGLHTQRMPLLANGSPVRCAELAQAAAIELSGEAGQDGLDASTVEGVPSAEEWPDELFVYGTLRPGERAWRLAEDLSTGAPRPATAYGRLYDTGLGFPGMVQDAEPGAPGELLRLADPPAALARLDAHEGPSFARVRTVLADGTACWTYRWNGGVDGMRALSRW